MATHVDLVRNDWLGGTSQRVATVSVIDGKMEVGGAERDVWRHPIEQVIASEHPASLTAEILTYLPRHFDGSYLFATQPHPDEDCPFHENDDLQLVVTAASEGPQGDNTALVPSQSAVTPTTESPDISSGVESAHGLRVSDEDIQRIIDENEAGVAELLAIYDAAESKYMAALSIPHPGLAHPASTDSAPLP